MPCSNWTLFRVGVSSDITIQVNRMQSMDPAVFKSRRRLKSLRQRSRWHSIVKPAAATTSLRNQSGFTSQRELALSMDSNKESWSTCRAAFWYRSSAHVPGGTSGNGESCGNMVVMPPVSVASCGAPRHCTSPCSSSLLFGNNVAMPPVSVAGNGAPRHFTSPCLAFAMSSSLLDEKILCPRPGRLLADNIE